MMNDAEMMQIAQLKHNINVQAKKVDDRLNELLSRKGPFGVGDSIVSDAMRYSILNGGKRIRPFLCLEFAKACGGNEDVALDFACAVEMIHTYSLIHDDLPCMDNDDMRRGKPSCHKIFGESNALLAGDSLLTRAFYVISSIDCNPRNRVSAINFLSEYSGIKGMIGGQVLDLKFENSQPTVDEVLTMYKLKTSYLLIAACQLGCLSCEQAPSVYLQEGASNYAINLGLAFQIQDDILDIISDEATLGKPVGSDEKNDKSTIVKFFGLEKAKKMVNEYTQKAIDALDDIDGDTSTLKEFALYMANRAY